jgi:hypothetical protein
MPRFAIRLLMKPTTYCEACRVRIETELRDDPRMKIQKQKQEEFVHRQLEEQDEKRRRLEPKEPEKDSMGRSMRARGHASSSPKRIVN